MNREKLTKIIVRDIDELKDIADEIRQDGATSLEIDIALSKAKLVIEELQLLKKNMEENKVEIQKKTEPVADEIADEIPEAIEDEIQDEIIIESEIEEETEPESEPDTEQEEEPVIEEEPVVELEEEPVMDPEPESEIEDEPEAESEPETDDEPEQVAELEIDTEPDEEEQEPVQEEEKTEEINEPEPVSQANAKTVGEKFQAGKSLNDLIGGNGTLDEKIATSPIKSLKASIGINDRFLFIRELFNNDTAKYAKTIEDMDQLENIKQAVDYLTSNMKMQKTETSLKFVELIKRRFAK